MKTYRVTLTKLVTDVLEASVDITTDNPEEAKLQALARAAELHWNYRCSAEEGEPEPELVEEMPSRPYRLQIDRWLTPAGMAPRAGAIIRIGVFDPENRHLGYWDDDEGALSGLISAALELAGDTSDDAPLPHRELVQAALEELGLPVPDDLTVRCNEP